MKKSVFIEMMKFAINRLYGISRPVLFIALTHRCFVLFQVKVTSLAHHRCLQVCQSSASHLWSRAVLLQKAPFLLRYHINLTASRSQVRTQRDAPKTIWILGEDPECFFHLCLCVNRNCCIWRTECHVHDCVWMSLKLPFEIFSSHLNKLFISFHSLAGWCLYCFFLESLRALVCGWLPCRVILNWHHSVWSYW